MRVYQTCVLSTLLYGSGTWTLYAHQERRLNAFHMRNLRRLLCITWQDRVTNASTWSSETDMSSMFAILTHRYLLWLQHVLRMEDGRIPKDILYGELASGTRRSGHPTVCYKDTCKRDLKACDINPADLEAATSVSWRSSVKYGAISAEERGESQRVGKRIRK